MTDPREPLGRLVRHTWVAWAREQPDAKPSWLTGWDDIDDGQRDVDMRIGVAVADHVLATGSRQYAAGILVGQQRAEQQAVRVVTALISKLVEDGTVELTAADLLAADRFGIVRAPGVDGGMFLWLVIDEPSASSLLLAAVAASRGAAHGAVVDQVADRLVRLASAPARGPADQVPDARRDALSVVAAGPLGQDVADCTR